jgi:hypothetical protein
VESVHRALQVHRVFQERVRVASPERVQVALPALVQAMSPEEEAQV